jgi:leader peptidase (prepilin peptidase) / N-methyltransferase
MLHPLAALLAALITAALGTALTLRDRALLPRALAYLATPSRTPDAGEVGEAAEEEAAEARDAAAAADTEARYAAGAAAAAVQAEVGPAVAELGGSAAAEGPAEGEDPVPPLMPPAAAGPGGSAEPDDAVPPLAPPAGWVLVVLAAVAVGLAVLGTGASWLLPAYVWLAVAGVALGIVDVAQHRLPNRIVYPSYLAGMVLLAVAALARGEWSAYARALVAAAALLVVFLLLALAAPNALGLGDVKLAGLLGLYLGYLGGGQLALGFVAGVLFGALAALLLLAARRAGWRTEFAYGPALLAGALLAVAVGQPLWDAYTRAAGLR